MTSRIITATPLTATAFAPWGDVIEVAGAPDKLINQGLCGRYHDKAHLDFADGRAGLSLFDAEARQMPYMLDMMERHPLGSQAFIPVSGTPFLVTVADDDGGSPSVPHAFITTPGQSVNLHRGVWHGVLAPLGQPGQYLVVDRIGEGANLEEHSFETPYVIEER